MKTKTQMANAKIAALIRARNPLLWITTVEEKRVDGACTEAGGSAGYPVVYWCCATGLIKSDGSVIDASDEIKDPGGILGYIREKKERCVYVLRDLHKFLADPFVLRNLRSLAHTLQSATREEARAIILVTPSNEVPPDLRGDAVVMDYPLPERREVAAILDDLLSSISKDVPNAVPNGQREAAIDAALGLTTEDIARCYSMSLVTTSGEKSGPRIDPTLVAQEKKSVINAVPGVEWFDPDPRGLAALGGLDLLKPWLIQRKGGFSQEAREFGLPAPKGVCLVGVSGCGKSLTAKTVANAWQVPLLKLDLGALQSKWIGESQANIRKALAVAETVSPCVLWLDEIEKALAGSGGSDQGDSGVAADALGTILTWMQERRGSVFVVATANDVSNLPPELLRKGRFDDLFWVDLPTSKERREILAVSMASHKRDVETVDVAQIARVTEGFSGAEIAALIPDALFVAFNDGKRDITTDDLCDAAKRIVPLSKTAAEKIEKLRTWAKSRARPASTPERADASEKRGALDL